MQIAFEALTDHIIPMNLFGRKWRFTEEKYDLLPSVDLEKLLPLDKEAASSLGNWIRGSGMHAEEPFAKSFFKSIRHKDFMEDNEAEVRNWLHAIGFAPDKIVVLSWDQEDAILVPWGLLIKYFDSFYYGGSDDLTVVDASLNWAVLFAHWDSVYYVYK